MPLTPKGEEIKSALTKEYGEKRGEQVLYAGKNKGTFSGIDADSYVWKKQTGEDKWHIFENGKRIATVGSEKEAREWIRTKRNKLDSDKLARIADGVDRLSARVDAMVDADTGKITYYARSRDNTIRERASSMDEAKKKAKELSAKHKKIVFANAYDIEGDVVQQATYYGGELGT